jgi:hypothetical protein
LYGELDRSRLDDDLLQGVNLYMDLGHSCPDVQRHLHRSAFRDFAFISRLASQVSFEAADATEASEFTHSHIYLFDRVFSHITLEAIAKAPGHNPRTAARTSCAHSPALGLHHKWSPQMISPHPSTMGRYCSDRPFMSWSHRRAPLSGGESGSARSSPWRRCGSSRRVVSDALFTSI